ncbi:MAG: dihydrofolate reductase family protein, partial [Pseudolabrys sp.]
MAKLVFGLNQSLDGYVDHDHQEFAPPGPSLFRHFTEQVRDLTGSVYGRRMYEVMRYWDEDRPEWDAVGEIQVGGPDLARSLTDLGLIDEYRLYFRPVVLGRGKPFFAG